MNSLIFWLYHPQLLKVQASNPKSISIGKGVGVGFFTRLLVNSPKTSSIQLKDRVWVGRSVEMQVYTNQNIKLGYRASIQDNCKIIGDVQIRPYCTFAPGVFLSSNNHTFDFKPELPIKIQDQLHPAPSKPILIDEDVWLGKDVFIKSGVRVGKGAIVGTGSLVFKDIPPYSIAVGAPAKVIKSRLDFNPPTQINAQNESHWPYFYYGFDIESPCDHGLKVREKKFELALDNSSASYQIEFYWSKPYINSTVTLLINGAKQSFKVENNQVQFTLNLSSNRAPGAPNISLCDLELLSIKKGAFYVRSITVL